MYRTGFLFVLIAVATILSGVSASADFIARNRMIATGNPAKAGFFEVFQRATAGPSDYWCAAGEFVRYGVREHNTTRIYVVRDLGPSLVRRGRNSVIFSYVKYDDIPTLSDAEKGYSVSISKPGYHLSAGHSSALCLKSLRRFQRRGMF